WEIAVVIFITNMRYLLMGAALSQKLRPETSLGTRLTVGFGVTDEIFGLGVAQEGYLSPAYLLTAFLLADLMWSSGTAVGIAAGNILPTAVVSALSVAIYGMFLAIIIPPARKNRVVGALVLLSFGVSWLAGVLPGVRELSEGMRTILLTLLLAGGAAALFPIKEEKA
ncbi:MAG: AzlC family ABC transporter permease, partial [bacterium]